MSSAAKGAAARRLLDAGRDTRAMRWVMAVMLFLTVIAAALGLGTAGAARMLDRQLAGRMTVQLLGADEATAGRIARELAGMRGVGSARVLPRAQLAELVEPWLGDAGLDGDLPMPAMIDLDMTDASTAATDAVAARAQTLAPGARVDRASRWLAPVRGFVVSIAWLAGGLVLLMASATAAIVLLTARAGLDTHRVTIDVLHMLGSTDVQVSRLFQRRIALDTLVGGAIGTAGGLAAVALLAGRLAALDSALVVGSGLTPVDWAVLAALPLAFALLAALAARVAILKALGRVL